MLYLNNPLLTVEGIIAEFRTEVLKDEPVEKASASAESETPKSRKKRTVNLLQRFQTKLLSIYYPKTILEEFKPTVIEYDRRFDTYPKLKEALKFIFDSVNKDNKVEIRENLAGIPVPEENAGNAEAQWTRLNEELGYFKDDRLPPLFTELARSCRAMSALIEDNLADEEMPYIYAYRLMVLFPSITASVTIEDIAKKTFTFLEQAKHKQFTYPYHDVILNMIHLPKRGDVKDLPGWLRLINEKSIGINFLEYFAMAPQIEAQIQKEFGEFKAPKDLSQAKAMATRCYYTRASENLELAELCKANKIPEDGDECSFNECLDYRNSLSRWPMKTEDNLPHPVIIGDGDAEGYCWVKLPTDDLRALILGRITACCQSIGGHSEQCVKDAVTLSDNGLFVLLKRKDKAARGSLPYEGNKINDAAFEIVGQSYAWISFTGNLTLDSLECSEGRVPTSVAKSILEQFATVVLAENPTIKRITLGIGGGTPRDIGLSLSTIPEQMRTGYQYSDSRNQYCIARQSKIPEVQFNEIMDNLGTGEFRDILNYLSDYLIDTSDFEEELRTLLKELPELKTTLNKEKLFRLLSLTSTPTLNDLRPIDWDSLEKLPEADRTQALSQITTARLFFKDLFPEELLKRLNFIPVAEHLRVIKAHRGILHTAAYNSDLLLELLRIYPESERLAAIKEKNSSGNTVLHTVAFHREPPKSLELLEMLLKMYPEAERLAAIKEKNSSGNTVLYLAATNPESFKRLLGMYPEAERLAAIKEKNSVGLAPILHLVESNLDLLITLIGMLPEDHRLGIITAKDKDEKTVLQRAVGHPQLLKTLLNIIPQQHLTDLTKTILHQAASGHPGSLKILLESFTKKDALLEACMEKDLRGKTVLHYAANKPESLEILLESFTKKDALPEAFMDKDNAGETVLHYAALKPNSLTILLDFFQKDALLGAFMETTHSGETVLDFATYNDESLKVIINALPETALKKLPPEILELDEVKQLIAERTKRPSQADLGLFKPNGETPGSSDETPSP